MRNAIRKIISAVKGRPDSIDPGVSAVRELIDESDLVFVPKSDLRFLIKESEDGSEGAWVSLLHLCQYEEGYEELLAASPFNGKKVLFAIHGLELTIEGGEDVMFDADGVMRNPRRVKAQFGNDATRWLEAWIYEPE